MSTHRMKFRQRSTRYVTALWHLVRARNWAAVVRLLGDVLEELVNIGAAVLAVLLALGGVVGTAVAAWSLGGAELLAALLAIAVFTVWVQLVRRRRPVPEESAVDDITAPMPVVREAVAS
jgi:hypothetical protein